MDMNIAALGLWGTIGALGCGSYMVGRFSKIPTWLTIVIPVSIPLLWFYIVIPPTDREQVMLIVGGWVIMVAVIFGGIAYAAARIGRSSKRRIDEYNKIRETYRS